MGDVTRLGEAEKQLAIFVENNGNEPYSAELEEISERLGEIRAGLSG